MGVENKNIMNGAWSLTDKLVEFAAVKNAEIARINTVIFQVKFKGKSPFSDKEDFNIGMPVALDEEVFRAACPRTADKAHGSDWILFCSMGDDFT